MTETSLALETNAALDILTRLRLKGFPLAIDDFGVGYSSLAQLRALPLSTLKVDKTFVRRMDRDPASRAIVERSIALGHDLGLTVVAEGVETRGVWDALQDAGCEAPEVLQHCRGGGEHGRGCWVVDLILGDRGGPDSTAAP